MVLALDVGSSRVERDDAVGVLVVADGGLLLGRLVSWQ